MRGPHLGRLVAGDLRLASSGFVPCPRAKSQHSQVILTPVLPSALLITVALCELPVGLWAGNSGLFVTSGSWRRISYLHPSVFRVRFRFRVRLVPAFSFSFSFSGGGVVRFRFRIRIVH